MYIYDMNKDKKRIHSETKDKMFRKVVEEAAKLVHEFNEGKAPHHR